MQTAEKTMVKIRWMIQRDMPEVLRIEKENFETPWTRDEFVECLKEKNRIGMVATNDDRIVGFMIYELHQASIGIVSLAVDQKRQRIGTQLVSKLANKLTKLKRSSITVAVRETNLGGQLFFKFLGFYATKILKDYDGTGCDSYLMEYELPT